MSAILSPKLQPAVIRILEKFRAEFQNEEARVEKFADFVRSALVKLDAILGKDKGGSLNAPIEAPDNKRIVRYYQSQGWISTPTRKKGREVIYEEIHLIQMLLSYSLRQLKWSKDEIKEVAEMNAEECLWTFSNGKISLRGNVTSTESKTTILELGPPCESFHILLVASSEVPETEGVARAMQSLALSNDQSVLKVEICHQGIVGDGNLRGLISPFREQYGIDEASLVQVVTSREHPLNWFADWGPENPRNGVVHLADYEFQFGVSRVALSASYSLLLAFCGELAERGISPYELFHRDGPRGCLFDSCVRKEEIVLKLLAGDICKVCLEKLRPHFTKELLREAMIFQDTIRDRVRVLRQFGGDPGVRLQEIMRRVYVHARIEANSSGRKANLPLPQEGSDLEDWCYDSRVGASLAISRELASLRRLADEGDERVFDGSKWNQGQDVILGKLSRLHPNLELVRIDSIRLESGKFIAEGATLLNKSENSWDFSFDGDLASIGISDTDATYAKIGETGLSLRFVNIDTHLRIVNEGGTVQAALRLPDNTVVDYLDGIPLRGCKAFHEKKDD